MPCCSHQCALSDWLRQALAAVCDVLLTCKVIHEAIVLQRLGIVAAGRCCCCMCNLLIMTPHLASHSCSPPVPPSALEVHTHVQQAPSARPSMQASPHSPLDMLRLPAVKHVLMVHTRTQREQLPARPVQCLAWSLTLQPQPVCVLWDMLIRLRVLQWQLPVLLALGLISTRMY